MYGLAVRPGCARVLTGWISPCSLSPAARAKHHTKSTCSSAHIARRSRISVTPRPAWPIRSHRPALDRRQMLGATARGSGRGAQLGPEERDQRTLGFFERAVRSGRRRSSKPSQMSNRSESHPAARHGIQAGCPYMRQGWGHACAAELMTDTAVLTKWHVSRWAALHRAAPSW